MKNFTKVLVTVLALVMAVSLVACADDKKADETTAPETTAPETTAPETEKGPDTEKSEGTMTYAEFVKTELEQPVVIEGYIQGAQKYSEKFGNTTLYIQDADGAYFAYRLKCTADEYAKFVIGQKVKISGTKAEWSGEIEITDATFEILEGNYVFEAKDATAILGTDDLINLQNQKVTFKGLKVEASKIEGDEKDYAWLYKYNGAGKEGDDLYFNVSLNGKTYTFCVESDLCDADSEVYKAVKALKVGDTLDVEGFMYWYNGPQVHVTGIKVAK